MPITLSKHESDFRLLFAPFLFAKGLFQCFDGEGVFLGSIILHGLLSGLVDLFFFGFRLFGILLFLGHQTLRSQTDAKQNDKAPQRKSIVHDHALYFYSVMC
ncbi:MAG: Uncharacterised protein [Flavobacteriia bacterium]|nr:MAG: Uncharacterised protein [Flavobacteriia bacterium]